ncbi:histidinol phosphate phosphatase [Clostridium sp. chh4-2]|uniref:histidinol-phosphatase HisJ family protein n=1 Tax=Clostridium sp. chh4-2 TaxID=2067550 RepID=UPI000CCF2D13|nr:histidinol-phosphatase HisJ family protein [Clostridium sp. chh4-2]PNV59810.1 histidinol phosphate phosphatase [Clostridium sp. chh4-2]
MFIDYHVHSSYSDDSEYPMEQIIEDAVEAGIEELCFTDHVDYGIKRDWDDPLGIEHCAGGEGEPETIALANVDYPRYVQEIASLQSKYEGRIIIRMGMEFGMQQHTIQKYEQLFAKYPFDFILLSVHQVGDKEFWTQEFQEGRTQKEYNERYYEELLYLVRHYQNYSVLGHLDLIARYDKAGVYPFEKFRPILTEILKTVIQNGKGIEVNTSCYRYGLHDLTPSRNILRLYRELGGKILTVGSDSHKKEHLGMYIPETLAELKEMGFETICTYHQMNPQFHKL